MSNTKSVSKIEVTTVAHKMDERHLASSSMLIDMMNMLGIPTIEIALEVLAVAGANLATHARGKKYTAEEAKEIVDRAFAFVKEACQCGEAGGGEHVH